MGRKFLLMLLAMLIFCNCTFGEMLDIDNIEVGQLVFDYPDEFLVYSPTAELYIGTRDNGEIFYVQYTNLESMIGDIIPEFIYKLGDSMMIDYMVEGINVYKKGTNTNGISFAIIDESMPIAILDQEYDSYYAFLIYEKSLMILGYMPLLNEKSEIFSKIENFIGCVSINDSKELNETAPLESDMLDIWLNDKQMNILLDENEYNVYLTDNVINEKSLSRTGKDKETIDAYMKVSNLELKVSPIECDLMEYSINVRVKKNTYEGIEAIGMFEDEMINAWAKSLSTAMGTTYYEVIDINNIKYCVFDYEYYLNDDEFVLQPRYATIYDEDMIYIYLDIENNVIKQEDRIKLKEFVESIEYK